MWSLIPWLAPPIAYILMAGLAPPFWQPERKREQWEINLRYGACAFGTLTLGYLTIEGTPYWWTSTLVCISALILIDMGFEQHYRAWVAEHGAHSPAFRVLFKLIRGTLYLPVVMAGEAAYNVVGLAVLAAQDQASPPLEPFPHDPEEDDWYWHWW